MDEVPPDFGFEPRRPRHGPLSVSGLFDTTFRPFLAIFGPFLGQIVELEGKTWLWFTEKSRRTSNDETVCLHFAVLTGFWGRFGPKKAVLGHNMRSFGRSPPDLVPPPWGANGDGLTQNLDLARPRPRPQDGCMGKRSKALGQSNGQNGMEMCLLLFVAC